MRYAKKSPDQLQALRRSLVERIAREQPSVAEAARWIRESIGLTQHEFAALVGVSTPQIARLERGEANPTLATLQAVGKPYRLQVGFVHPDTRLPDGPDTQVAPPSSSKPRPLPPLTFDKPAKS